MLKLFCAQADVIERLRLQYKKDHLKVVDIVLSHQVYTQSEFLDVISWLILYRTPLVYDVNVKYFFTSSMCACWFLGSQGKK